MLEDKLVFPEEAIAAARNLAINQWRIREISDDIVTAVECEISNNLQGAFIDYGVANAVISGKRIRLLHEMPTDRLSMNCAEVGVNAFLIYHAFAGNDSMFLMRYNDGHHPIDHFAVVNYDMGKDQPPTILDPLFGFSGRLEFTPNGFVHIPSNLLHLKSLPPEEQRFTRAIYSDEEVEVNRIATPYTLMTVDDVMRHINYINSPLGFFDYFKNTQVLQKQTHMLTEAEWRARSMDD